MLRTMDDVDDMGEWMEAFRLEADGDPSAFVSHVTSRLPPQVQELARSVLRKLPRARAPTENTVRIADAVVFLESPERSKPPSDSEVNDAASRFNIKGGTVLANALARNRGDVNDELRRRSHRKPSY
jgi:hypothetical protein